MLIKGGIEDISYLYLAKHIPTNVIVGLKFTDMTISPDFDFIDELIVCHDLFMSEISFEYYAMQTQELIAVLPYVCSRRELVGYYTSYICIFMFDLYRLGHVGNYSGIRIPMDLMNMSCAPS
jgi:hypothetical protein